MHLCVRWENYVNMYLTKKYLKKNNKRIVLHNIVKKTILQEQIQNKRYYWSQMSNFWITYCVTPEQRLSYLSVEKQLRVIYDTGSFLWENLNLTNKAKYGDSLFLVFMSKWSKICHFLA